MANDPTPDERDWPVFRSLRGATPAGLSHDLVAGLTLAAIAIPEQMATARLGGFAPQIGLFAFVAATLGFAAFGANRQLSAGADSTITPIFAGSLGLMAAVGSPQYAELAAVLALMVGVMLAVGGVLKLGWIADLLSRPVMTGFLAGISLHIVLSQAPSVLGLAGGSGDVFHKLAALWAQIGGINLASVAIGIGVFAVTLGAEKLNPRIPGALIALVAATAATVTFGLDGRGVAVLGQVAGGFPQLSLPRIGLDSALKLVGLAFVVSLVVMVQTAATTRSFSGGTGSGGTGSGGTGSGGAGGGTSGGDAGDPDVNDDYMGIGFGGVLAGLVGAFPVNASPPRTAVVAETGGRSQWAGLLAALAVLLLAAFGTRFLAHVPAAALAGVLLFVAQRIFHVRTFSDILRKSLAEFALAFLTTTLIIVLPIQTGVAVGMFLSLAHGVFTITRARPIPFERVPQTTVWWPASREHPGETEPGALVLGFQAPLSFLNAYDFRRGVVDAITDANGSVRLIVLEASSIVEIDFTASAILAEVIARARSHGKDFAVARLESVRAQAAFDRFGLTERLGRDHLFHSVEEAIRALGTGAGA
ncbi:MAG: SulP family inorganic anion transporter [Caulobacterales bacterium]